MFTGIITAKGEVSSLPFDNTSGRFEIKILTPKNTQESGFLEHTRFGDSIAVNGVCLTVVEFTETSFFVEVSQETINRTNFDKLTVGQIVNLEHAIKFGDSIDGHMVQGHIDTTCFVDEVLPVGHNTKLILKLIETKYSKYIAEKGSIALNGISLTVNEVFEDGFAVNIIPYTFSATNLSSVKIGECLNLEVDMFARYCVNYLQKTHGFENILTME